ncbi:MAG: hypothetical protein QXS19_08705 [Candidatus Methanomethylicia archaeon]
MRPTNKKSILQKGVLTSSDILNLFGNRDKVLEYTSFEESYFRYISFLLKGGFYVDKNTYKSVRLEIPQYVSEIRDKQVILKELIEKDFDRMNEHVSFLEDKLAQVFEKSKNKNSPTERSIKSNLYKLRVYLERLDRDINHLGESLQDFDKELDRSIKTLNKIRSLKIDAIQYDTVEVRFEYDESAASYEYYKEDDEYDDVYVDDDVDESLGEYELEDNIDTDIHAHTAPFVFLNDKGEMAFHPSYPYYKVYYSLKMEGYMETVNKKEILMQINKIPYYILPAFIKLIGEAIEKSEYYGDV